MPHRHARFGDVESLGAALTWHCREIASAFDLLGHDENDLSTALGFTWSAAQQTRLRHWHRHCHRDVTIWPLWSHPLTSTQFRSWSKTRTSALPTWLNSATTSASTMALCSLTTDHHRGPFASINRAVADRPSASEPPPGAMSRASLRVRHSRRISVRGPGHPGHRAGPHSGKVAHLQVVGAVTRVTLAHQAGLIAGG